MTAPKLSPRPSAAKRSRVDQTPAAKSRSKKQQTSGVHLLEDSTESAAVNVKAKKSAKLLRSSPGPAGLVNDPLRLAIAQDGIRGKITGIHGDVLQGWALDSRTPDLCLAIEVFYDGVFGHLVRADAWVREPEFVQAESHGFIVRLKSEWLKTTDRITARVANQGPWLEGAIDLGNGSVGFSPAYASKYLYHSNGLRLMGWAAAAQNSPTYLGVRILHENRLVAQGVANRRMAFLKDKPYQGHGFEIDLPWELADGVKRKLDVVTDDGEPLTGSPVEVCVTGTTHVSMVSQALCSLLNGKADKRNLQASDSLQALLPVLTAHERLYPSTFGFSHYQQWCELYQAPPLQERLSVKCAVLVVSETLKDAGCEQSVQSVLSQRLPEEQVDCLVVKPLALMQALRQVASTADLIVPVFSGDQLAPHAVDMMAKSLSSLSSGSSLLSGWGYADSDTLQDPGNFTQRGQPGGFCRIRPWLKPDWDETLFYGRDYVTPGIYLSAAAVKAVLAQCDRAGESFSTWSEFLVRVIAVVGDPVHLHWVLYHERSSQSDGSLKVAPNIERSGHVRRLSHQNRLLALNWLVNERVPGAFVQVDAHGPADDNRYRVVWPLPKTLPTVSVIIPTRDGFELLQAVTEGLMERTSYPQLELLVVDNESTCPKTSALFGRLKKAGAKVLSYPKPFNYSAINNLAAEHAKGELLLFLNNDIEMIDADWLSEMVVQFQRPDIGVVGKKLLWPNSMVQHAGVVVGINGLAAHAFTACHADDPGYQGLNLVDREQSAITGACLMIRREDFMRVGGFDEDSLPVAFNDVDLCLKVRQKGKKVVLTTGLPLIHNESSSRGKEDSAQKMARARRERDTFIARWMLSDKPFQDPYYHPGLNRDYLSGPYTGLGQPALYK